MLAWAWCGDEQQWLAVINYADVTAQASLSLADIALPTGELLFRDHWQGVNYERNSNELKQRGPYVELPPFASHVFEILSSF